MKAGKGLLLQYLSEYRLESAVNKHAKKYSVLEAASLTLKIAALLLLIIFFRYFYIAIAVWILSVAVNSFKRNLVYRYVYVIGNGKIKVFKEYNVEKHELCVETDIATEITDFGFYEPQGDLYYGENDGNVFVVKCADKTYSIVADTYFYALTDYYKRGNNDFSR